MSVLERSSAGLLACDVRRRRGAIVPVVRRWGLGGVLRAAVYRAAVLTTLPRWIQRWRGGALVLAYHNVVGTTALRGDRSLHVPVARFRAQLERLVPRFRFVPLVELLARHRSGRSIRGLAAVTFDDGYRGVLRHALPVLQQLGVPATV